MAQVKNGIGDASQFDFIRGKSFELTGEWQFYWNHLQDPSNTDSSQAAFIRVPGSWARQDYSTLGYATYKLILKLPEDQRGLSIYFPIINSAAKIWVNGQVVTQSGFVGSTADLHKPKLGATIVPLPDKVSTVELIIQVSNYSYFSAGIAGTPEVGDTASIFSRINQTNGVENFFAGSLVAMFVYQLILFFLYHQGRPHLWLSLICLSVALRALIVHGGSFLLPNVFPGVEWEVWKKIEFGGVYAIVALFPLYVYHLFVEHAPRKPLIFFIGLAIILCSIVLFTPQYVYGRLLDVTHLGLLLAFVYAVYSISKAWRSGNDDAKVILFGVLASFPFILFEILKNSRYLSLSVDFMYLVELGVLVFLLFQVYLLANHYAKAYRHLETLNLDLEKIVDERTQELVTANTVKDRLLSVMSHDIKSPLNSLRGVLQTFRSGSLSRDEFTTLTSQVETDLSKTTLLVENILYWTASQLKGVHVKKEKVDVYKLIEGNIHLFKTIADSKQVTINHNAPQGFQVISDPNILNLLLRNLIANALKFSFERGLIEVRVSKTNQFFLIQVADNGVGMDAKTVQNLMSLSQTESTSGTQNEMGTGLGIIAVQKLLTKNRWHA